jgi:hypothetical protein
MYYRGHEVYVLFEDVLALDDDVDPLRDGHVYVRTRSGARLELPIECVAQWEVETPLGGEVEIPDQSRSNGRAGSTGPGSAVVTP